MPKVSDEHRAARREQILEAASACFARQGFHRTTMKDVVREANLSPGAVYGYFAGKADIVEAIAAERHARERDVFERLAGRPTAEVLRGLAHEFLGELSRSEGRERRRVGVQIWAEALRDPRVLRFVRRGVDEPRALLSQVIHEGQRRGEIPPGLDADAASRAMIALFHGFVLQQSWDPRLEVAPYLELVELAIDALLAAPSTQRARRKGRATRAGASAR